MEDSTRPSPTPVSTPPKMAVRNRSSLSSTMPGITPRKADRASVAASVLAKNPAPFILTAKKKRGIFSTTVVSHSGRPVSFFTMIAMPETPPVTRFIGSNRALMANAMINVPTSMRT